MLFGGGQGTPGDCLAQLLSIALLACLLWRWREARLRTVPAGTWAPVALVVATPLLQVLPLPAGTWGALSGRGELAAQLQAAGVAPAPRWSLDPVATERSLWWLLPGIAAYLSVLRMRSEQHARIVSVVLALAAVNVALGLAQLAGGPQSPLRFYSNTNPTGAVGLFANRNHLACLLATAVPLAVVRLGGSVAGDRGLALLSRVGAALLLVLLLLGLAMTLSRAGILLGMLALVATVPLLWRLRIEAGVRRVAFAALLLSSALVVQLALWAIVQRFSEDPLGNDRVSIAATTLHAAAAYSPAGSGIGTFRLAFPPFEANEARADMSKVVNHAHDDYLELWLEAGWLVVPVGVLLLATLAVAAWRALAGAPSPRERLERAGLVVALAVPLLHSLVDYPLRTSALIAVSGSLLGMVVARSRSPSRSRTDAPAGRLAAPVAD